MKLALNPSVESIIVPPKKGRRQQNIPPLSIPSLTPPAPADGKERVVHPPTALEEKTPEVAIIQGHLTVSF